MWIIIIVVLIGTPFVFIDALGSGHPDGSTLLWSGIVFLLALGGAAKKLQDMRVADAQRKAWLNQHK